MVKLSHYFGKNLWCTFTQMLNEKKYKFFIFWVIKVELQVNIQLSKLKRPRKEFTMKKKHYKPYMAKKTIYPGPRESPKKTY